jgi:16S rRNA pseudouridine516 synthase
MRFGIEVPEDLQKELEGLTYTDVARYFKDRFHIPDSISEIGDAWLQMAGEKYRNTIPLKPGVREFLAEVKSRNLKTAIASSNHLQLIEDILRIHGIYDYIDAITTCDDVGLGKPDPEVYTVTAGKLGIDPGACLVFEDIPVGIQAGKAAGMRVIAVEDTYSEHMREEKARLADGYITDFRELL